ncbi:MAG: threonine/serine exporter family protein [Alloprevotella sp.]|nr:threonine/serine exporter family protein [Bacteroidales bacterium]MDY2778839.1 threonine/serine exporter family protein [Alloprevotella sp.]
MEITTLFTDGLFASMAAIGFGSINNTPRSLLPWCGFIAAIGHATRFGLINASFHLNIILAGFAGSICIGIISLLVSRRYSCPYEVLAFPALLPMIPGMYAYGTIQALISYLQYLSDGTPSEHYLNVLAYNAIMTMLIILFMVVGALVGIFVSEKFCGFRRGQRKG